ncbi:helix-turn-helix domain-containing protein [Streptomyces sp. TRM 70361]|uniref:helix-turn-helix domain-containing protein n=1 Tax=Streptomyces sp. TRM 70361 TaxID=3116553 RepID=UPI002E7C3253|nr:helix-turn-helix domain-containing protein [Streptomyces sp. TRM 70361]MEE1938831.1 helix-turn-helix domain-containing protein [Streptomyces sp. TRM 70361]
MGHDGTSELAAALRDLKGRTGHSFETLATRTGISRSALHRYCSGKSVPAVFGTVERFAKRCGADRDELVELHRLWVLATESSGPPSPEPRPERRPEPVAAPVTTAPPASLPAASPATAPVPSRRQPSGRALAAFRPSVRHWPRFLAGALAAAVVGAVLIAGVRGAAEAADDERLLLSDACPDTVGQGQQGECVREVQRLIAGAGGRTAADGRFVGDTRRAVLAFQALAGVRPNGVVDQATKRALYEGGVSLATWDRDRVTDHIRKVFTEDPEAAVRTAECRSLLDPHYVLSHPDTSRTWGVFQISEERLRKMGATPADALDPKWNIETAHRLWGGGDSGRRPRCLVSLEPGPRFGDG